MIQDFVTTGIPVRMGRAFRKQDETNDARAVIVSEKLVRDIWNGLNPLGRRIEISNDEGSGGPVGMPGTFDFRPGLLEKGHQVFEVVGVVGDVANDLIAEKERPAIYFPAAPGRLRPAFVARCDTDGTIRARGGWSRRGAPRNFGNGRKHYALQPSQHDGADRSVHVPATGGG